MDACMRCQRSPRRGSWPFVPLRSRCFCGADLAESHESSTRRPEVVIAAQKAVLNVIVRDCASFGIYAIDRPAARSVLSDIATLTNQVLARASTTGFSSVRPEELVKFITATGMDVRTRPQSRGLSATTPPARALDAAVGVTAALSILEAPDVEVAAERAAWLFGGIRTRMGAMLAAAAGKDTTAAAVLTRAFLTGVGPITQLRWRTASRVPSAPDHRDGQLKQIAAGLPTMFWPSWIERLHVTTKDRNHSVERALAAATLLVGSTASAGYVVGLLGGWIGDETVLQNIWKMSKLEHWTLINAAVTRLNAYLAEHPSPIDYARRRSLDYSSLLPEETWREIRRDDRVQPEEAALGWVFARSYLIEKMSGSPTPTGDFIHYANSPRTWRSQLQDFPLTMTAQLSERLDIEARAFLSRHKINEPTTWAPPLNLIADLCFPLSAADNIDINELHELSLQRNPAPSAHQLAEHFGVDPFAIRFLFERQPIDAAKIPWPRGQEGA